MNAVARDSLVLPATKPSWVANTSATLDKTIWRLYLVRGSSAADETPTRGSFADVKDRFRRAMESTGTSWREPHTSELDAEVLFEWWKTEKKLSIYFDKHSKRLEYIKVWGAHIDDDMESGELQSVSDFRALWTWLHVGD
jgi:hypothetical protein